MKQHQIELARLSRLCPLDFSLSGFPHTLMSCPRFFLVPSASVLHFRVAPAGALRTPRAIRSTKVLSPDVNLIAMASNLLYSVTSVLRFWVLYSVTPKMHKHDLSTQQAGPTSVNDHPSVGFYS